MQAADDLAPGRVGERGLVALALPDDGTVHPERVGDVAVGMLLDDDLDGGHQRPRYRRSEHTRGRVASRRVHVASMAAKVPAVSG